MKLSKCKFTSGWCPGATEETKQAASEYPQPKKKKKKKNGKKKLNKKKSINELQKQASSSLPGMYL